MSETGSDSIRCIIIETLSQSSRGARSRSQQLTFPAFVFTPHACPQVLQTGSDAISGLVTIVSYDLAQRLAAPLNAAKFKVIVCDEAHFLKNDNAKRTQIIVPLVQAAKRALLLTGAPWTPR